VDRNSKQKGLVNFLTLLVLGGAVFATGRYAGALAGQVAAVFFGVGALIALVSWFQMRLEERELAEQMELEELARTKTSSTLFEAKEASFLPARTARIQFEKYFVSIFMVALLTAEIVGFVLLWRWLGRGEFTGVVPARMMVALGLFAGLALVLFMIGRFMVTMARVENNRLLRPTANFILLGAYLAALAAAAVVGDKIDFPKADLYAAKLLCVLLGLVALEGILTVIFELYRPRLKGRIARPLYDSRLIGLLAQPEGLVATAAQTLDYQFGFKVSETWFFRMLKERLGLMFVIQFSVLLASTCVVFIEPGEQALLERFGKPVAGREVLPPGPHVKLPWPVDKVYRYPTEQIQSLLVGSMPKDNEVHSVVLWTVSHMQDEVNYIVADRTYGGVTTETEGRADRKVPPVSLLTTSVPIQYQVTNILDWVYRHKSGSNLLQQLATREVVRYLVSADVNELMSSQRQAAADELRARIQTAALAQQLGVKVLFVGLQDMHPPVKVAPEYEKVVAARQRRQAAIITAEAEAVRTNTLAGAQALAITNRAEAARLDLELRETARAAAFTNQIPAFAAAPDVYRQRLYAQVFPRAVAKARKYVIVSTNTHNVITFDLQHNAMDNMIQQQAESILKSDQ
jgi:modulator of FtsH protease HflK